MQAAAILQLLLLLLPSVETGVTELIAWINSIRNSLKQSGEWTDAQEAAYRAALFAKTQDPAYAPDPPAVP